MAIKMSLPDDNSIKKIASSGSYLPENTVSNHKYASPQTANVPITKNAQYAGTGASVVWTQPMFFSPLHTPQNWQIPSRRREAMQWARFYYCLTPDNLILMSDGTEKRIDEICIGDKVVNGDGGASSVKEIHSRDISENILHIKVGGNNRKLKITMQHEIPIVKQEEWKRHPDTVCGKRRQKRLLNKNGNFKIEPQWLKSRDIEKGDRMYTPITKMGSGYDRSIDECYLMGMFLAEGSYYWYDYKEKRRYPKAIRFSIHANEKETIGKRIEEIIKKEYGKNVCYYPQSGEECIDVVSHGKYLSKRVYDIVGDGCKTKIINEEFINSANRDQLLSFLGGYIDGDGCVDAHHGCQIITASDILVSQISFIMEKLGLTFSIFKTQSKIRKVPKEKYSKNKIYAYNIRINRFCIDNNDILKYSFKNKKVSARHTKYREYLCLQDRMYRAITSIEEVFYEGRVYDLELEDVHSYCANRCVVHNCNEPKVAAGVDFYSNFSQNGFKLECKSKKILRYYEKLVEKLDLAEKLNCISHEYFLIGDVFPFLEISCPTCHGTNRKADGSECNHPDGTFKSIKLMNPDYIDVRDNPISSASEYYLIPDEELKMIVSRKEPKSVYEKLPQNLINLIMSGQPIPLSRRSISHIKHNASDYGTYGTSMLQRLFTILAYKTKIMTANWIVAERLILPLRVVKVGDKDRPASESDLSDVVNQLAAVANDPNLTIVTHHAFEYDWHGASSHIHNISSEMEYIGKEILDGLMLNQALLNGEMGGYCFSEDTLTLTDSGFKYYYEIDEEKDLIACYNPETNQIEYHKAYEKVVYDYDGEMIHFNNEEVDILVTPNHRMCVFNEELKEYEFVRAENISSDARFIRAIDGVIDGELEKEIKKETHRKIFSKKSERLFYTSSESEANKFAEKVFKCGYIADIKKKNEKYIVNVYKNTKDKSININNKDIKRSPYNGKIYCFSVPYELFVTMRNGKITIQGNTSAQVGVETLIRRLENWRNKLKIWVEKHVFLPIAMMQGFVDEEESRELGETVYLYPSFIWNDLQLRDKTSKTQILIQLYDKGLVSAQTILGELDLDYDSEVEKIRSESVLASANGQLAGGGAGGAMGGGLGGGMDLGMGGGMPPDIGGEPTGAPMGGMDAGGAPMGDMGGAPAGGEMGAAASTNLPVIKKRGQKKQEEEMRTPPPSPVRLTKLEYKVLQMLQGINVPSELFAQYSVKVPGEKRAFSLDFAYPKLGVGVEADGGIWHERQDFQQRDMLRDQKLANRGWRILRFKEEAIEEHPEIVEKVIREHIADAMKQYKKSSEEGCFKKYASAEDSSINPIYEKMLIDGDSIGCNRENIPYGQIMYIGKVDNE